MSKTNAPVHQRPAELLQNLIRFDTTNPPGNERPCIEYLNSLLKDAGVETTLLATTPERPNLIARLKGEGKAPPLLLYGHVDVVTTEGQQWTHPPFEGRIMDGYIWGRGALDMKSGVAMLLAAFLKAKAEKATLPGDVIFCAVADEEAGGDYGSRFLVNEHADLFKDVKYAFGEFGGFNMSMGGKRMVPIMVAEKQCCWMKVTFHGRGGHGSMPVHHQAMAKLARTLSLLDQKQLPYHLTPAVRLMLTSIADALGGVTGLAVRALTSPLLAEAIIGTLGERGSIFAPLLHNTISPTILKASDKVNVIPSEVSIGLDGRLLPGFTPKDMKNEMHALLGTDFDLGVLEYEPGPATPNMGLFDTLGAVIKEFDPQGIAVPYVMSGVTDARFFTKLGIQTYGFTPLQLPDDFSFIGTIHAADERVPVVALDFGVQAIFQAIQRFH
ncbi:MAG: M20/M25/M40 family metallo-hydrolase [Chloroflexi bacterium]|nr:M20/M25/M40 family metallo-hydrolase [Chloroflexota bacterium]